MKNYGLECPDCGARGMIRVVPMLYQCPQCGRRYQLRDLLHRLMDGPKVFSQGRLPTIEQPAIRHLELVKLERNVR